MRLKAGGRSEKRAKFRFGEEKKLERNGMAYRHESVRISRDEGGGIESTEERGGRLGGKDLIWSNMEKENGDEVQKRF